MIKTERTPVCWGHSCGKKQYAANTKLLRVTDLLLNKVSSVSQWIRSQACNHNLNNCLTKPEGYIWKSYRILIQILKLISHYDTKKGFQISPHAKKSTNDSANWREIDCNKNKLSDRSENGKIFFYLDSY